MRETTDGVVTITAPGTEEASMTLAAITGYNISIWLHVTAVMVGFGATFAEAIMFPIAQKLDPRHLPYVHALGSAINKWMATPGLVVVLITGFYQVSEGNWSLGDAWISATLAIVVVIAVINLAYFIPGDKKMLAMAKRDIAAAGDGPVTMSEEYLKKGQTVGIFGTATGILLVAAVFLMVVKPGM
jgi:uncharacterized membrane protein